MTAIQDAAQQVAKTAEIYREMSRELKDSEVSREEALDHACQTYVGIGLQARTRTGVWASETKTETLEAALFNASVAKDALDNTSRPSTGPVRDYVLGQMKG